MPEYPDVTIYIEALERRIVGAALCALRITHPFLLRTVEPSPSELVGRRVEAVTRLGKQIVIGLEGELFAVIHLMVAGRLHWTECATLPAEAAPAPARAAARPSPPKRIGLAAFDFTSGTLILTEAGTKKRAALRLVGGRDALRLLDRGGLELFEAAEADFAATLRRESHTLKRALTDPRLFSGIGNSYSDEILHRARLSPFKLTGQMTDAECVRLFESCRGVLSEWTVALREATGDLFPDHVTAFRKEMAVHGKYGKPCPVCGTLVQHVVYAENECNYCPTCQTEGRLLADRSLSRLLKGDWPETLQELEEMRRPH